MNLNTGQYAPEESTFNTVTATSAERSAALQYLKSNVGSLEEQQENWKTCLLERLSFLESHSIYEYINSFPVLRTQIGYKLLLLDFNHRFAAKKNALYGCWEYLSRAITQIGVQKGDLAEELLQNPNGL